jgi:hypothetical protein
MAYAEVVSIVRVATSHRRIADGKRILWRKMDNMLAESERLVNAWGREPVHDDG